MKKIMKNLLMMALAVFVGKVFAAETLEPVATWTNFNNDPEGYTLTKAEGCKVNDDGSITLGGNGLQLNLTGAEDLRTEKVSHLSVVMDVTLPESFPENMSLTSFCLDNNYRAEVRVVSSILKSCWWNQTNGSDSQRTGEYTLTPGRQTITITYKGASNEGTHAYVNGQEQLRDTGMFSSGNPVSYLTIGARYNGATEEYDLPATGVTIHSLRLYSTKLSADEVKADYLNQEGAQWIAPFNGNNIAMGWITSFGDSNEPFATFVDTPNGKGGVVAEGKHPWSSYNVSTPFTVALYANVAEISNSKASLLALGNKNNYVALIKTDSDTIEVWKNGSCVEGLTITDTDFAVHSSYHLIVFGNDENGSFLQINDQKVTAASIESSADGLQIGAIYQGVPNGIRRAYGLVVDEVRGFGAKLNENHLTKLQVKFPKYLPPEQKIEVEGEVRYSNLEIQEGSRLTINVNSGSTLILDEEVVTLTSLHIETKGTLDNPAKIDLSAESDPFDNVGNVSISGTGAELIVDIYNSNKVVKLDTLEVVGLFSNAEATADKPQEVSTKIAIASDKTLKTKGYLNFTEENTIAGTLEVVSGVTTFNLARVGLSGTVKVAAGATFKNGTNDGPHYNTTPTLDIAGTLEIINNARWSLPTGSKTTLREGAVLKGTATGDYKYSYDFFDGATITVLGNAEIQGCIGSHNGRTITFDISKGKALMVSGVYDGGIYQGSPKLAVASSAEGEGVGTLVLAGANTYTGTTTINSGTTLVAASATALGTGNVTLDGTLTFKDVEAELSNQITQTDPDNTDNPTGQIVIDNSTVTLKGANGDYKGLITINEGAILKTETRHYAPFGNGASIVNNGTIDVTNNGTGDCAIPAAISGSGSLTVSAGTLILTGANTYNGATTIAEGAKVIANSNNSSTWDYVSNGDWVRELDITVNGELEIQSSGELYRGFAGAGKIVINADALIGNTGDSGFTSGLSRFKGTLIVAAEKTLTLRTWGNQYDVVLTALEVNGTVKGETKGSGGKPVVIKTSTLSGSGTIENTLALANGATLAGAVTVTGNVTVEGAVNVTHADEAGDTVITCANAEAVAARLTGAPQGLKYVAEEGAVKLALAKVTVTLPAVQNAVWKDAEGNTITSIEVDPNSSASVKLETTGDYVFADGSTSMDVTIASGDADSEATAPADALIVAAKAKIGETLYASVGAACEAAADGATIVLLQDLAIAETKVMNFDKTLILDFNGTEQTATADPAILVTAGNLTLKNGAIVAPGVVIQQGEKGKEQTTSVTIAEDMILGSRKIVDEETGEADGDNVVLLYGKATLVSEGQLTSCSKEYATIQGSGGDKGASTSITINGGFVYQLNGNVAIYQPQAGTVTINGGVIMGGTGIEMRNGTLTVNGGTIKAGANYAVNANGNGSTVIGAAIAVSPHAGVESITANINGGTIGDDETAKALAIVNTIDAMPPAISATIDADATINMDKVEVDVSDMEFKENENDDGYTLGMKTTGAIIKNEWYETLQAAINAAAEGDTVILLGDVTASEIITINKAITLNGNGKTLTYTGSDRAIEMPNNAEAKLNVTLKNLTVDCTASYCQRGINYNDDGALVLNNVTVKGTNVTYALNLPGYSDNCVVEITDSSLTGNIALNVWGANSTITATNSEFVSVDNSNAEGYVAISLNNDGAGNAATGSVVTINGGKIIAKDENGNASTAVRVETTATVNVSKETEVVGDTKYEYAIVTYEGSTDFYSFDNLQDAINKAIETNGKVVLINNITIDKKLSISDSVVIDGNGFTITYTGTDRAIDVPNTANGANVTIMNLTINAEEANRGLNYNTTGEFTVENVVVTIGANVDGYAINFPGSADGAKVTITNSKLTSRTPLNIWGENMEINVVDSEITSVDNSSTYFYSAIQLNKDTYGNAANGTVVTVTGGKLTALDEKGKPSFAVTNWSETGIVNISDTTVVIGNVQEVVAWIGGVGFTSLQAAINSEYTGTITLLRDVTLSDILVINKAITLDGNGKTLTSTAARAINVSGADGVTIKNLKINCSGERAINIIQGATNVTIDNVTATAANYTVNVAASAPNAVVAIKNSTLNGLCTVNVAAAGAKVTVDNSTVNCNDNNTTVGESYAALSLNKEAVGGSIVATGTTVKVTEGSDSMAGRNGAESGTVTINGSTEGVAVKVAAITYEGSDYYYTFDSLESAIEFAKAGDTITLIRDVTASEIITIDKAITLDGNGKTLTYTGSDRAIEMPNNAEAKLNVTLKNLTVDCTASYCQRGINYNDDGALVLNNVTVKGTNVTYALNLPGYSDNCVVTITDSNFTGNIALNVWGANSTITATDSEFVSVDKNTAEGYVAISLNNDGAGNAATGSVVTINGGKIIAKDENGEASTAVRVETTATVNVSAETEVVGDTKYEYAIVTYEGSTDFYSFDNLQDAIDKAIATNGKVVLINNITIDKKLTISDSVEIDGNGFTITYMGSDRAIDIPANADKQVNVTIKNLTVDCTASYCQRGINYNDDGALVLNNVTVKGTNVTYALNLPGSSDNCEVEINNSSLTGNIALNVWGENATINATNTTFTAVDNNTVEGYAAVKLNNDGTTSAEGSVINIVGGKIDVTGSACADTEAVSNGTATGDVNISDTTVVNGKIVEMVAVIRYAGGTSYSFYNLADAFAKAQAGDTIILLRDVTLSEILTINKAITLDGNGKTLTSTAGRAINVSGADGVTIKNLTINASGERAINIIQNATNVTIDNVTATAANYTVNVAASAPNAVVAITNSTLNGLCTVNVSAAGAQITVDNSTVNCNDNNTTVGESYAALSLNKEAVGGTIVATNTTVNVAAGSDSMKGRNGAEDGTVTINGSSDGVAVKVAAITYEGSDYYYTFDSLESAIEFAKAGDTITLIRDVTASDIIVLDKAITLDGNGKTLTSTAGRAINVSGADGVTIQNLTIDAKGERAINIIQNATNVTIENVTATAANYTVNVAASAPNAVVAINNSNFTGLNVVNVAAAGAEVAITGGTITCNDQSGVENYAALALNPDAKDAKITATSVTFDIKGDSKKASNGAEGGVITIDGKTEGVSVPVAIITYGNNAYTFATLQDAVDYAQAGETIKVIAEVNVDAAIEVAKKVTIDLNGQTVRTTENDKSGDGVFCVVAGGDLTINDSVGTGVINGVGGNNYNIAIWANGGKVTINGGNFTNVGATDNTDPNAHFDLIYVKNGGEVVINGGTFECETPAFTLNSHDTYKGVITVNGGTFVGFDPRNNAAETAGTTFMAAGKYTFAEGGNYIVVTPEDYILNGVASNSATVGDVDSLLAGAVTVTKDGEKYVATATYTFKVTAVDTINPEKSSYELTGGKLRPGKTVAVKYIDLATGTEAWEKPESDTVTFKLVIK